MSYSTLADAGDYVSLYCLRQSCRNVDILDCHRIVGLYTDQNRVPLAPSLCWVSCKERERVPHQGANFHSSLVHYPCSEISRISPVNPTPTSTSWMVHPLWETFSLATPGTRYW